jgi:hypothetical protein
MPFSKISFNFFNRLVDARVNEKETNVQGSIALLCIYIYNVNVIVISDVQFQVNIIVAANDK